MRFLILALILCLATVASASGNSNNCPGYSCHAQGGDGGNASATGGNADARSTSVSGSNSDARSTSVSGAMAGSSSNSGAKSSADSVNVNGQRLSVDDHSVYEATKATSSSASDAMGGSEATDADVCGNTTGVSAQGTFAGAGFARPGAACIIQKHVTFQKNNSGAAAAFESITFWASSPFVLVYAMIFGAP